MYVVCQDRPGEQAAAQFDRQRSTADNPIPAVRTNDIIPLLDHIIVAGETGETFSFRREGLMDQFRTSQKEWER